MLITTSFTTLQVIAYVAAFQTGPTKELHPSFPIKKCTREGGCIQQDTAIVLDANYRKINDTLTGKSCFNTTSGGLHTTICSSAEECAERCAIDDIKDYAAHGIFVKGNSVTLSQWLDIGGARIPSFHEFSYWTKAETAMDQDGGGKAAYGTGYCDAGCPKSPWINDVANIDEEGACCAELDIWEANSKATALALHPCKADGFHKCSGKACKEACAANGCGYNPYALGNFGFYAPDGEVDTRRPFTVVTQFVTDDRTSHAMLSEVKRFYIQDRKIVENAGVKLGYETVNSATDEYCAATNASSFQKSGAMAQMGKELQSGMVPILCIWNQKGGNMTWLDGKGNGPCNESEGDPASIILKNPGTSVTFSDIRWGDLGSTASGFDSSMSLD